MIGRAAEKRGQWLQALVISLALHGVAAAAILDVLPSFPQKSQPPRLPDLDIVSLPVEQGSVTSVTMQELRPVSPSPAPQTASAAPSSPTNQPEPVNTPVLAPSDEIRAITATRPDRRPDNPDAPEAVTPLDPTPSQGVNLASAAQGLRPSDGAGSAPSQGSAAQSLAISDLVQRLRGALAQPCIVALPQTIGGEEVMLTVMGAVDRDIAGLFRDLTGAVEVPMTERSVLLDPRQCPAVDFARSSASYPAFPLKLQLEASEVASDDRLIGQIEGAGDNQTALLLIDDNGVVQDLRRFTLQQGDAIRFDVPVYRVGGDRDTSQLLMAVALPQRPGTIAEQAGRLAGDFFPPLVEAAAGRALIGVAPVYVRASR